MTRSETIFTAVFVLINTFFIGVFSGRMIEEKSQPKAIEVATEESKSQPIDATNPPAMFSNWRTPTQPGMAPLHALRATSERMQIEQGTDLGSDANARALILVMEAVAILEGRDRTVDGIQVIE